MFKKFLLVSVLTIGSANAQPYWLNMVVNGESMSLPVSSDERCTKAVNQYVRSNLVNFVSCDVEPLRDAVNVSR